MTGRRAGTAIRAVAPGGRLGCWAGSVQPVRWAPPAAAAPGDWWQFGSTAANTRSNPNETTSDDGLVSLDARTGTVRWRVAGVFGDPAVAGGRVLAGTAGGQLQARSAATGALLWSRPGGTLQSAPSVTGGMVHALGTENGASRLFARRADTGALAWKRALPGALSFAWPAVAGARVVAVTSAGISAFDAASGAARWRATVAGASSPAVANGLVFAGLAQGIGAWRLSDGVRRWRYGTIAYGAPVVSGGRLYVAASTQGGDQPVAVVDQFALGAAAPGVVR